MEISLNDALLLQNKGNKILFDPPPPHTHTHTHTDKKAQGYKLSQVFVYTTSP